MPRTYPPNEGRMARKSAYGENKRGRSSISEEHEDNKGKSFNHGWYISKPRTQNRKLLKVKGKR